MTLTEFIESMIEVRDKGFGDLQVYLGHHCASYPDLIYTQVAVFEKFKHGAWNKTYLRLEGRDGR